MRSLSGRSSWSQPAVLAAALALLPVRAAADQPAAVAGALVPVPGLDEEEGDAPGSMLAVPGGAAVPGGTSASGGAPAEPVAVPDLTALRADPVRGIPSSGFGWRDDPIRHRSRFHYGGDFRAPRGTPVYAAGGGTVLYCGRRHGYGRVIDIVHDGGLLTRYAHLSAIDVERGQQVEADALIGRVGSTGRATGPHLHFEVRVAGRAVDPTEAMRVAELQRGDLPEVAQLAAIALRAFATTAVSAIDPPRARGARGERSRSAKDRSRRRRPNVS